MRLLKLNQHHTNKRVFKFIYTHGYLYTLDAFGIRSFISNSILLDYTEVPIGYKYEDS